MNTLKAWDTINGAMGTCFATIDGNREEMLYVKNIEAKINKNKKEIKVLGQTGYKHKANGWSGTGTMTIYYSTSKFRELMLEYVRTGKDTYFDIVIENSDPSSTIGRQSVVLRQVNINSVVMTKLDINSTELDEEIAFTFNDVSILEKFSPLVGE